MLDEERLQYVGSMVLGLNDALVELTGSLAGFTFALQNTRLIASHQHRRGGDLLRGGHSGQALPGR